MRQAPEERHKNLKVLKVLLDVVRIMRPHNRFHFGTLAKAPDLRYISVIAPSNDAELISCSPNDYVRTHKARRTNRKTLRLSAIYHFWL